MLNNLTPYVINIYNSDNELVESVPPSGQVARIETTSTPPLVRTVDGVEFYGSCATGEPQGLPPQKDGIINIVSGSFRSFVKRDDLYEPGRLLTDEQGRPIGFVGLSR